MNNTTDNQDELFDIVDENDNVIGQATRGEVHKDKNLIHRSVGVVVFDKKGEIFLQQRSSTKDTDPLKWTISASGHVGSCGSLPSNPQYRIFQTRPVFSGFVSLRHSIFSSVKRTLLHLGRSSKLVLSTLSGAYLSSRHLQTQTLYEKAAHRELVEELGVDLEIEQVCKYLCRELNETEMQMIFKAYSEGPFELNKEEIIQGKFFTQNELVRLVKLGKLELSFSGKMALEKIGFIFP